MRANHCGSPSVLKIEYSALPITYLVRRQAARSQSQKDYQHS